MTDPFGFEKTFAAVERIRGEIAGRLKSNDGVDVSIVGKQRLADAADRLAQLHRERDRIDGEIKLAERNLGEAKRVVERVAAPSSDKATPGGGKAAPTKVRAAKSAKSK